MFKRKTLIVNSSSAETLPEVRSKKERASDFTVLVVNSSHEMAREITTQLTIKFPFCSILYAPSLELAKWILQRRSIKLVVSSSTLPDGNVVKLRQTLEKLSDPPDVVVVGNMRIGNVEFFGDCGYQFSGYKRLSNAGDDYSQTETEIIESESDSVVENIKGLGENIRNDLNNPLQEIVAMVFVAAHSRGDDSATSSALDAIEKAAKNMSGIVNSLENKIMTAVASTK